MRILILTNNDSGLYHFRGELLKALLREKHEVYIALPYGECVPVMEEMGCRFIDTPFARHGLNPVGELKLLRRYRKILRELRPDAVLTYTIKPNVYGGMACARMGVPYIANITGLGTAIETEGALQKFVLRLYRFGLRKAWMVFFQNGENQRYMVERRVVKGKHALLPGSGVSLTEYRPEPYPADTEALVFSTFGRIMKDKGTDELLQAAKEIKRRYPKVIFRLIGSFDGDYEAIVAAAAREGTIEYIEQQRDVHPFLAASHAVVHPSYHEGMSNVLLEAAATGRPVLASDVPGCRETFDEGVSGMGFPSRDGGALAETIERFIRLPYDRKAEMGAAGRKKMEREFDREIVVNAYMKVLDHCKASGEK